MDKSIYNESYRRVVGSLRKARLDRGMSQREVGHRLQVARSWVGKIENCDLRLDLLQLVRLCHLYGLKASRLLEEMEECPSEEEGPSSPFSMAISA